MDYADVMLIGERRLRSMSPTSPLVTELDTVLQRLQQGPSLKAAVAEAVIGCPGPYCGFTFGPKPLPRTGQYQQYAQRGLRGCTAAVAAHIPKPSMTPVSPNNIGPTVNRQSAALTKEPTTE